MNKDLVDTLKILNKGRMDLVQSYAEKNSERYRYSFQYHRSPAARGIAACLLDHQWLDRQMEYAFSLYNEGSISKGSLDLYLNTIKKISIFESKGMFIGYNELIKTKILGLQSLLERNERMDEKLRSIEFDLYRDKVLFEMEMDRYTKEIDI